MKTNRFKKVLAIFLSVLLATPMFVLTSFADGDPVFHSVYTSTSSCASGETWYNRKALATATDTAAYKSAYIYLSEDETILKIQYTVNGETMTELHYFDTEPQYFDYLCVVPEFGDPLPTSPDGLEDGAYWYDQAGLVSLFESVASGQSLYPYENATFRLSVDYTILRMTCPMEGYDFTYNNDEFLDDPGYICGFLHQVGVDPNAGFTPLPTSDEGLNDGDYWFDLASFLDLLDESNRQIYQNAQFYISEDGTTIRIILGSTIDFTEEEEPTFFRFLHQVGVDPNEGFTLLPTSDEGLEDGTYWYDADALAAAVGDTELVQSMQFYLSDDGTTIRVISPAIQYDFTNESDEGALFFSYLRQVGVDPNAIEGFILLPTSDEGLEDGDYWYDAAGFAAMAGDDDYLTMLYYLSEDGNTLRLKYQGGYTFDIARTQDGSYTYYQFLHQVGVDPNAGYTLLPTSDDGLEDGTWWFDAAGFAAAIGDDGPLSAEYYLSDDGETLRIYKDGQMMEYSNTPDYAYYFMFLHQAGVDPNAGFTLLPTSSDGLSDGDYWFDAAGFAASEDDEILLSAEYYLSDDGNMLRISVEGMRYDFENTAENAEYFAFLHQVSVDPNAGFTLLPTALDGLNNGDYWYDAAGLAAEGNDDRFLTSEYYLSTDGNTLRIIYDGTSYDLSADDAEAAVFFAFLRQVVFNLLPTSEDGLNDGDWWYDKAGLSALVDGYFDDAQFYLSGDESTLRIILNGQMINMTKQPDYAVYFYYLRQVGVDPNAGFVLLPVSDEGLNTGDYWYDAAGLAAAENDDDLLTAAFYLSEDGTILRLNVAGFVAEYPAEDEGSAKYWTYLCQVAEDPNAGFTLLPTSDDGLADGDYWFDATSLNFVAQNEFEGAAFYLSDDGTTLRVILGDETIDFTQEDAEGAMFFLFLRQVGVDPNAGFVYLPTSPDGLADGEYWFDAAGLAAAEESPEYLNVDYYLSEDGTTLRFVLSGYHEDITLEDEEGELYFSFLHRVGENTGTACLTLSATNEPVYTGDTVVVTVNLAQNPGLAAMSLALNYDADVLTLTNVQTSGMLSTGNLTLGGNLNAQPFNVLWEDATAHDNHTETGTILTLTFTVKENAAAGETTVTLTYDPLSTFDVDLQDVPMEIGSAAITVMQRISGDVNGDGELSLMDVTTLMRYLVGGWDVTIDEHNCDVNGDGFVDLKDAVLIRRYLAGWDVVLV